MIIFKDREEGEDFPSSTAIGRLYSDDKFRGFYFLYYSGNMKTLYRLDKVRFQWKLLTFTKRSIYNIK